MNIVAANHADTLRRPGSEDRPERLLLDVIGDDLRACYGETEDALPIFLVAAARRLDDGRNRTAFAA